MKKNHQNLGTDESPNGDMLTVSQPIRNVDLHIEIRAVMGISVISDRVI
jgi:hypothetical protein